MDEGGIIKQYLGLNFTFQEDGSISIDQKHYLRSKIEEFSPYIGIGSRSTLPSDYIEQMENMKNEEQIFLPRNSW